MLFSWLILNFHQIILFWNSINPYVLLGLLNFFSILKLLVQCSLILVLCCSCSLCCSVFCALIVLSVVFSLFFTWWLMLDINILKLSTSSLYKKCLSSARFLHDIASWYEGTTGEPCVGNALNDFQLYNSQKSLFKKPSSK